MTLNKVSVQVQVELNPEQMAEWFANSDSDVQARFMLALWPELKKACRAEWRAEVQLSYMMDAMARLGGDDYNIFDAFNNELDARETAPPEDVLEDMRTAMSPTADQRSESIAELAANISISKIKIDVDQVSKEFEAYAKAAGRWSDGTKSPCRYCNGTKVIELATSVVPCTECK